MQVSVEVVQQHLTWEEIVRRVRLAEDVGFDGVWVFDHLKPLGGDPNGPCLEGWTVLAGLAALTRRVRLGTLVTGVTYRHPAILTAQAIAVDHISGGRLELGLGAAWFEGEHRQMGLPFPGPRERSERLDESIQLIRRLMTGHSETWNGQYYELSDATYRPSPLQKPHPPIWIGAQGEKRMLPVVARQADVWHASAPLEIMIRKSILLDGLAQQAGRDPRAIARAGSLQIRDPADVLRRNAEGFRQAGFSHLVVAAWEGDGDILEQFAGSTLPELQKL